MCVTYLILAYSSIPTQTHRRIHTGAHTHTHRRTHTQTHTPIHTQTHTPIHTQTDTPIHTYTYTHRHTHTHSYTHTGAHRHTRTHTHTSAYLGFEVILHAQTARFTDDVTSSDLVPLHATYQGSDLISGLRLVHVLVEHFDSWKRGYGVRSCVKR